MLWTFCIILTRNFLNERKCRREQLRQVELDASSDDSDEELTTMDNNKAEVLGSSEFALKMINAVKSMNNDEISHYEMVNSFTIADEMKCLLHVYKSITI